ncbi:hypothetical protein DICVIV_00387 [Dictyocaulus viviparus]|uniref:G-protein coupled receptors family 1 profile domain-containing protein n=1 Tax=Dictyocaulus viviparus TaxID=29172 RepID=A0A0D8YBN4_DICVI|nr:hypothetical protein DICVIV_00387 [Dictyocaulus viviparus]
MIDIVVMLALIRYMTLRSRGNAGGIQIGLTHSYFAIAATICFIAIVNAPNFLTYKIHERRLNDTCVIKDPSLLGAAAYLPGIAEIALAQHCLVFRLVFWISGLVFKVIPCCLLSLFVWLLLGILKEVKANRQRLLKNSHLTVGTAPVRNGKGTQLTSTDKHHRTSSIKELARSSRGERTDRTTNMLLAIVFVMLFTEMPQGIMALLSGMVSQEFRRHIYNNLGDLLDLFSLCEACMSFIIYCSMSGQFRNEFRRVFIPKSVHCLQNAPSIRRPSDIYTKMSYLKPNDTYENGSSSHIDAVHTDVTKEVSSECAKHIDVPHLTPSPNFTSSVSRSRDELSTDEDEQRRLIDVQDSIVNGSIKEQQFKNI